MPERIRNILYPNVHFRKSQEGARDPNMDYKVAAKQFVDTYYAMFDNIQNRQTLQQVYKDTSTISYEGNEFAGLQNIMTRLMALPADIKREITSLDAMPMSETCLLVHVMGQQKTNDENDRPFSFTHVFVLMAEGGGLTISKEIFRLVLHNF